MRWAKRVYLLLFLLFPYVLFADAIIVSQAMKASTIAELFIEQQAVRVELEIGIDSLPAFRNILPDPIYEKLSHEPEPLDQRLERFFSESFIVEADGILLDGLQSRSTRDG